MVQNVLDYITHSNLCINHSRQRENTRLVVNIKQFWINSYTSDKVAFWFELVSFIFTVQASMLLAIRADAPDMLLVYPGFLIGAITQAYASYRRGAAWVMMITIYFVFVNILGIGVALRLW